MSPCRSEARHYMRQSLRLLATTFKMRETRMDFAFEDELRIVRSPRKTFVQKHARLRKPVHHVVVVRTRRPGETVPSPIAY